MTIIKRTGWPAKGELVACTVSRVLPNSVFCRLDEYEDKVGMIHISEIAPGRIRNIREYATEGKFMICKVLAVDEKKGHIDLSLRRVSDAMRRAKANELKREQRAAKIIELAAAELDMPARELFDKIGPVLFGRAGTIFDSLEAAALRGLSLASLGIEPRIAAKLEEITKARIKPEIATIGARLRLTSWAPDGVELIRTALRPFEEAEGVSIKYVGNGSYLVKVSSGDFKLAERTLRGLVEKAEATMRSRDGVFEFTKL